MSWSDLVGVVAPEILQNALETSKALRALRVPHAVIGGLAVGIHGYPRATQDVDFLVGREAADDTAPRGLTDKVDALYQHGRVEFLLARSREPDRSVLQDALHELQRRQADVPVIGVRELIWLKLDTPPVRAEHDRNDIRQLLRAGAVDAVAVLDWLEMLDEGKAEAFAELIQEVHAGG